MLDQLKKQKIRICLDRLERIDKDLGETLDYIESADYISRVNSLRKNVETSLKQGNFNISEIEGILEEIPRKDLNKEVLDDYNMERSLYEFRRELLMEVFKEAYKKSIQIKQKEESA